VQDLRFRANDLLADAKLTAGGQAESDAAGLGARCPLEPPGSVFNGKAKHAVWWQALRAAGVPIVASWLDQPFNHDGGSPRRMNGRHTGTDAAGKLPKRISS
jgi:hypothetical protein